MIYCKYITWIIIFSFSSNLVISQELANLNTDPNIKISIFASNIDSPRQLAEGEDGRIYVGSRNAGEIYAIRDTDKNGVVDEKLLVAKNLTYATGISIFAGDLYLENRKYFSSPFSRPAQITRKISCY
jgi:glucose/arabinose dehydrogenase